MINAKNIVKKFKSGSGEITALAGIDFAVAEGEFVSITGRSGSGKSTLLYQLSLLDHPTDGEIVIDGVEVMGLSSEDRTEFRLHELGYVFQDYAILPALTAKENVMLPLLMQGKSSQYSKEKAEIALIKVGLGDRMENYPSQLSGGQQQRVAIARAIAHSPKIIFADEPTANLDSETSQTVLDTFLDLHKEGQTIVMVTHESEYAALTDRTIVLSDGKIIQDQRNKK
ncbi:MAG: putative transport system ATP-binding protein [Patescibacteria group bacterium]|nr:putative transport system ATP-binding protein [Patescibacteria group bacterium]MDQ5961824.1 putative transport system ATP-binding protein [Patescibacteria group bacterium]